MLLSFLKSFSSAIDFIYLSLCLCLLVSKIVFIIFFYINVAFACENIGKISISHRVALIILISIIIICFRPFPLYLFCTRFTRGVILMNFKKKVKTKSNQQRKRINNTHLDEEDLSK